VFFCGSRIFKAVSSVALLCALASCGKDNDLTSPFSGNGSTGPLGIVFDSSVPADQKNYLIGDIELVSSLNMSVNRHQQYVSYVGVSDFSAASLASWLQARTKLIVGESFDYERAAVPGENRSYNPQVLADNYDAVGKIQTVMFNLGAYIYLNGKSSSKLYNIQLGTGSYPVLSPRVGIFQIGEGMFQANSIKGSPVESMANRLLRAAVFFHEARHTDGNGTFAALPHAKCTEGDYKGYSSCENNLNGPYVVEALVLSQFYDNCNECSTSERDSMRAFIADNLSRLLQGADMRDARPEAIQ